MQFARVLLMRFNSSEHEYHEKSEHEFNELPELRFL